MSDFNNLFQYCNNLLNIHTNTGVYTGGDPSVDPSVYPSGNPSGDPSGDTDVDTGVDTDIINDIDFINRNNKVVSDADSDAVSDAVSDDARNNTNISPVLKITFHPNGIKGYDCIWTQRVIKTVISYELQDGQKNEIQATAFLYNSESYIEFEGDLNDLIGKSIIGIDYIESLECEENDEGVCCEKIDKYHISTNNGFIFEFNLINISNGYYDGNIEITNPSSLIEPKIYKPQSIIIIVGLYGCGKSEFAKSFENSIIIFNDNDIYTFNIKTFTDNPVIIVSPSSCDIDIYNYIISRMCILNKSEAVITYCFLPDIEQSRKNIEKSNRNYENLYKLDEYNKIYDPYNTKYINPYFISTFGCENIEVKCARNKR